jgi:hypothetical protein
VRVWIRFFSLQIGSTFFCSRVIQSYLRVQKRGENIPGHVTKDQLPYKNTEGHIYLNDVTRYQTKTKFMKCKSAREPAT